MFKLYDMKPQLENCIELCIALHIAMTLFRTSMIPKECSDLMTTKTAYKDLLKLAPFCCA